MAYTEEWMFVGEANPPKFSTNPYDLGTITDPLLIVSTAALRLLMFGNLKASYNMAGDMQQFSLALSITWSPSSGFLVMSLPSQICRLCYLKS